ncbi:PTS system mannose/fructose/sorbose family transporter subunit IID [Desulfonatronum thioautotrophicum]|uniref:PTS system mannose/fructose/sorbose family transporter subunit IID n=1 Tax=Desulfonatronum thioautotrophicum TaxID=617001 RepID=UPI0005EB06BD|nr:PTS system mannose/fructose/sorbose family transporter subunit IID [Desulfonatronum thioautotrophicum]
MNTSETRPPNPSFRDMLVIFLRTYAVGANYNTRGMQNVGLALTLEPGLRSIHRDARELQKARRRALQHYNTHPFWTPLLAGIFLSLERDISRGVLPAPMLQRVKNTTTYTLSALGDSFFSGALLVLCILLLTLLLVVGWFGFAWLWLMFCILGVQLFKLMTFIGGFREGIGFLSRLKRWNLINWSQRIKLVNAGLLLVLWWQLWPELGSVGEPWWAWIFWTTAVLVSVFGAFWFRFSRLWFVPAILMLWIGLLATWNGGI